ncbi:MAG: hypothetical protein MUF43_06440 [Flavobacterium sp.]|jgi:hypothetical protein|nr:hypothetical protein [Flavobacterium sp.]
MKKIMFSAVALVAFSFAGMANEIEEKKIEEFTLNQNQPGCLKYAVRNANKVLSVAPDMDDEEFNDIYNSLLEACNEAGGAGNIGEIVVVTN